MAAAILSLLLGILGNILSILVFSSPLPTFWRIFKRKSTENFKGLPYVCTLLSTSLWTYYGLMKAGGTLILTINAAGAVLQSFYLILFLIYAPQPRKKQTFILALLLDVVCFGSIFVATFLAKKGSSRVFLVGAICSAISVSMYASPLVAVRLMVQTRSVEFMPFFLSLFLFLNGGCWSVYALLINDIFVEIPNAIGFVLGGVQLALYVYYKYFGKLLVKGDEDKHQSFHGENLIGVDLEMGRSASLPKHSSPNKQSSSNTLSKHHSLPAKIIKTSSAKLIELLDFIQDNDPILQRASRHGNSIQDRAIQMREEQHSPQ